MIKRVIVVLMLAIFGLAAGYAEAGKDYSTELERSKKELAEIEAKLAAQKAILKELNKEFNEADIALRQDLIACKADMDEKTHIRESKRREGQLRKDHQAKMKPAKAEYNRLKIAYRNCRKKTKTLERKIDRLANDPESEVFNKKMENFKQQIKDTNDMMHAGIEDIYTKADRKIDQITDMSNKSKIRSQILSDAKTEELALRKEYKEKKQALVAQMDQARSQYRKNLAEFRAKQAEAQRGEIKTAPESKARHRGEKQEKQKSSPSTNFSKAR
jgi:chromosome segregation ATPase